MSSALSKDPKDHSDVERELSAHPKVTGCAVTRVELSVWNTAVVAYATGRATGQELRRYLAQRLPAARVPQTVVILPSLPRTPDGEIDYEGLPLPVQDRKVSRSPKGGDFEPPRAGGAILFTAPVAAVAAYLLTDVFWPYSTDLSAVPQPWAQLFFGLYVAEWASFGLGFAFLLFGRAWLARQRRPGWLTTLTHLSIFWLLAAWWPQDNFYRLAAKTDWPLQAALVYGFNVTLMIAAVIVFAHLATGPVRRRR
ncbi:hypothetical protein [Spongiactinospora sp. TRM90649]|uniref:AMP-binding enzyme n=1 Tax=Spongiactinospora sp. TRM90649 TaxID=3031114 RepID=UPI0023F88C24|nr:hypothetical protein [Spongiactinospora sp. TRM90649]MDF5754208.1 hypothetical protein [Spongiactinospora sp. TRM90649]